MPLYFSNLHRLHHYVLHVDPNPNTTARRSTKILHDEKEYELDGFSVFFHKPLPQNFPQSPLSKWSNEYSVCFYKENPPEVISEFMLLPKRNYGVSFFDNASELRAKFACASAKTLWIS